MKIICITGRYPCEDIINENYCSLLEEKAEQ